MSALHFGVPHSDGLLCDHPTCTERANWRIVVKQEGGPDRELFACTPHETAMMTGRIVMRNEMLAQPGERNRPLE
jgi:hypothetical protein